MELLIYQVVFIMTTLFSGSDAGPIVSSQTQTTGVEQSRDYPRISQNPNSLDNSSSTKGTRVDRRISEGQKELQPEIPVSPPTKQTITIKIRLAVDPRTGKKVAQFSKLGRKKRRCRRYVLQGSRWYWNPVTWQIPDNEWTNDMTNTEVNKTIAKAFRTWSEVAHIHFQWLDPPAVVDIRVQFETGDHNDGHSFDGVGNVLAHAFYPNASDPALRGDIHFDDDETWTNDPNSSDTQLLSVAVHEIGHSLGLRHTRRAGAIMNPQYTPSSTVVLSDDDVRGIQSIYGKCYPKVTAIESELAYGDTYIWHASNYWLLNDPKRETARGYPKLISSKWNNILDDIDEVVIWAHNWRMYFFKASIYWRYNMYTNNIDPGYPMLISSGWPGLPDDIDAGFTHSNLVTYFFKGRYVYEWDNSCDCLKAGYPKLIRDVWTTVPDNLDSAFRWYYDGQTYFFKSWYYWKWNHATNSTDGPYATWDGFKNICNPL